ncbi:MAG: hypothetical protein WC823_02890 [Parcubacteria group bacterium]|jgi:hypothetical protein
MDDQLSQREKSIPDKMDIEGLVKKDAEKFNTIYYKSFKTIKKSIGIEGFILTWAFIEEIMLPSLIRWIAHRLKMKEMPNIKKMTASQLIATYYFISHDLTLYKNLLRANSMRNDIIHGVYGESGSNKTVEEYNRSKEYLLNDVAVPILERFSGNPIVPVLTLYSQGWNECRDKIIAIIKSK